MSLAILVSQSSKINRERISLANERIDWLTDRVNQLQQPGNRYLS